MPRLRNSRLVPYALLSPGNNAFALTITIGGVESASLPRTLAREQQDGE
jgi:hypothetical protein